ncbi:MAG: transposase [Clostridia bacterium]|nr:transposase [Clostridia bacterium]
MYNPNIHKRKSIRLKGYDYSQEGYYFITICTQGRQKIFGKIIKDEMVLSRYGLEAQKILVNLQRRLGQKISINSYIIMPNHIHLILILKKNNIINLKDFITTYKSVVSKKINKKESIKLWQRNYYEHIIRNEKELYAITEYIENNPKNWDKDSLKA